MEINKLNPHDKYLNHMGQMDETLRASNKTVIPERFSRGSRLWIPAFAGMTRLLLGTLNTPHMRKLTQGKNRKRTTSHPKGYILLTVLFFMMMIPGFIAMTYFNVINQTKNIESRIQDIQLKWVAQSAVDRAQFELRHLVDVKTLEDEQIFRKEDSVSLLEGTDLNQIISHCLTQTGAPLAGNDYACTHSNWFNALFKTNFVNFAQNEQAIPSQTVQSSRLTTNCAGNCYFVKLNGIDSVLGSADFTLNIRARSSADESTSQSWGIAQAISLSTSNLADYSIFTSKDLTTSPGTDTVYEGPIYVGGNAYVTPNKGSKITLTMNPLDFATERPTPFVLKAHGSFNWFGPRTLAPDPYTYTGSNYVYNPEQPLASADAEKDVFGVPTLYYFSSNNDPGWRDLNNNHIIDNNEKSTLEVLDKNLQDYVQLVGNDHPAPPLSYSHDNSFNSWRDRAEIDPSRYVGDYPNGGPLSNFKTTTLHTPLADLNKNGAIVPTSTAFNGNANETPRYENGEPWNNFLDDHFTLPVNGADFKIFEDGISKQNLRLGGADKPEILIELAKDTETISSYQDVKLEWLAKKGSLNSTLPYTGIVIDLRHYLCNQRSHGHHDAYQCSGNTFSIWANEILPEDWETAGVLKGITSGSTTYKDQRRDNRLLQVITIDIGRLREIVNYNNGGIIPPTVSSRMVDIPNNKPIILYIGLPENNEISLTSGNFINANYDAVVRLVNASNIPDSGLTIGSNGFIQISGDYNTTPPENDSVCLQSAVNSGADLQSIMKPAAVVGDQVMILSKSWKDWGSTTPLNYTDPFDGNLYSSPVGGNPAALYPPHDYHSHPIRCNKLTDPNCGDVKVNAMLIGGDVKNQLVKYTSLPQYNYSNWGYYGVGQWFWPSYNLGLNHWDPILTYDYIYAQVYLNKGHVKYEYGHEVYDDPNNLDDDADHQKNALNTWWKDNEPGNKEIIGNFTTGNPVIDKDKTQWTEQNFEDAYNAIPVFTVTYHPVTDMPIETRVLGPGNQPGTVGNLFKKKTEGGECDTCNGRIPLYLNVDGSGNIQTNDIESNHIKRGLNSGSTAIGATGGGSDVWLVPGQRFASLALAREGDWAPLLIPSFISPTTDYGPPIAGQGCGSYLLKPDFSIDTTTFCPAHPPAAPGDGDNAYWPVPSDQAHFSACTNVACQGCSGCADNNYTCGSGEHACQTTPDICKPACQNHCGWWCPPGYPIAHWELNSPVRDKKVVYTIGGLHRLTGSKTPNLGYGEDPQSDKHKFYYIPYWAPMYNGGLENFIRLSENWNKWTCNGPACTETTNKHTLTINGTMDILWEAKTLKNGDTPYFWTSNTYTAPEREFHYARQLRVKQCVPPGIPNAIQISSKGFKQK